MVHPDREGVEVYNGHSFDKNSMYPWAMTQPMPYGLPVKFEGRYTRDPEYPLYIQFLSCEFSVRTGYLPTIQIKNNMNYTPTKYLSETVEQTFLALTSVDLSLFFDHYDVYNIRWEGGYKFKCVHGIFDDYVNYWYDIKAKSKGAMRSIAKLMLNAFYGKTASRTHIRSKIPYLGDDDIIHYRLSEPETKAPIYTAVASFITSYARDSVIRSAQALGGSRPDSHFCYMDTDSVHVCDISVEDVEKLIEVHPSKLGAWKHEYSFDRAKYLRQKCYIEEIAYHEGEVAYYEYVKKCAGMSDAIKDVVSYDDFEFGFTVDGLKLKPTYVPGGVVLTPTPFTLKR